MGTIEQSVIVERPVDEVWDVWTDVRLLPDLSHSTTAVARAPRLAACSAASRTARHSFSWLPPQA